MAEISKIKKEIKKYRYVYESVFFALNIIMKIV
jgi:hypothetical protein